MKKQRYNSKVWINKHKVESGHGMIYVRIYVNSYRAEISSNFKIPIKHWCNKKSRVKSTYQGSTRINGYLDRMESECKKHFLYYEAMDETVTAKMVKNKFLGKEELNNPKKKTIMEAFDYHNIRMEEQLEIGKIVSKTLSRYRTTKNRVKTFIQYQYKVDDMPLPEMRLNFATEFKHYLLTKKGIQTNTAHKYIKNLKKIMNMSVGLDWIPSNPFNNFRCGYTTTEREVLSQEELDVMRLKDLEIPHLVEARDVFIFCCYTGFAYSDIYKFENNALAKGIDGGFWLSTNRQKTGTKESVPLLPIAIEIAEKYRNHKQCVKANKLLPVDTNQRYNAYLKEIAKICGIKKKITSHIARHTFATTVTLANGVPIETVSSMLGHNSIRTTQIYAKVVEKKVSEDMLSLKDKLFGNVPEAEKERKIG